MAREISSSTEYVLDDFDEEFPELYNALYQNALSGRARQARKACELATLGRRLAAQPRFGGLRDPGRLVQRPSHAPEVAELTAALRTARRSAQLLRDEILGQTPQAKAAADARARKIRTPDRPTQSKRSAVVGTPNSGELEDLEGDAFLSADPGENLGVPSETRSRGAGADANLRRVRDRVSRPVRSPPKSSRAVLSQIVGDDAVACELAQLDACQAGLEKASRAGVRTQARVSTTSYRPRTALCREGRNPPPRVSPGNVLQRHATAEAYTGRLSCRDPSVALFARPATAGYWSSQEKLLRFD